MKNFTKKHYVASVLFFLTLIPSSCFAWSGKVLSVTDGNIIKVMHKGKAEKIRLYGIESPAKKQIYAQKAREFLSSFVAGENVEIERKDKDKNGIIAALVSVNGESINELMVLNGFAWVQLQYCKEKICSDWIKMENAAKHEKKGMWSESTTIPSAESHHPKK